MLKRNVGLWIVGILAAAFILFFARTLAPTPEPKSPEMAPNIKEPAKPAVKKPGDYFPLTEGSQWIYQGEGNEFASFNRKVLFTKGNLAQIREDNGGTVSAAVFRTTEDAVTRIFFQGEAYEGTNFLDQPPTENVVILKTPIETGTKWDTPNGTRQIIDVNATVETPAGTFDNCVIVKIANQNSTVLEHFEEGVGMVKREFTSGEVRVTSSLQSYTITID